MGTGASGVFKFRLLCAVDACLACIARARCAGCSRSESCVSALAYGVAGGWHISAPVPEARPTGAALESSQCWERSTGTYAANLSETSIRALESMRDVPPVLAAKPKGAGSSQTGNAGTPVETECRARRACRADPLPGNWDAGSTFCARLHGLVCGTRGSTGRTLGSGINKLRKLLPLVPPAAAGILPCFCSALWSKQHTHSHR